MTLLERARALVETYETELRSELPADAYLFDVHTHLGDCLLYTSPSPRDRS